MKCKTHGTKLISQTVLNEALCHIQHLIDNSLFCPDCQSKIIQDKLANPNTDCKICPQKNDTCFAGWAGGDGETMATSGWGGAGPDCLSVPEGVRQSWLPANQRS